MSFDFIAPLYDRLAALVFGNALNDAPHWCTDRVPPHCRVLVLGGGTGTLLPWLLATDPRRVVYLEASEKMLSLAQQKLQGLADSQLVEFRAGTEAALEPDEIFDVMLLPFVLDLYSENTLSEHLLPRLLGSLSREGMLLVCDFDQPVVYWQRLQLWVMIRFFRLVAGIEINKLPDWSLLLQQKGFAEVEQATLRRGQIRMGRWQRLIPSPTPGTPRATR